MYVQTSRQCHGKLCVKALLSFYVQMYVDIDNFPLHINQKRSGMRLSNRKTFCITKLVDPIIGETPAGTVYTGIYSVSRYLACKIAN